MKKALISLICLLLLNGAAFAKGQSSLFKSGIYQYKSGNYTGCMETMKKVITEDPGNAVAHYYLGMAYTQAGLKEEAIREYNSVISLNRNSSLATYAQRGLANLGGAATSSTGSPGQLPAPPEMSDKPGQLPSVPGSPSSPATASHKPAQFSKDPYVSDKVQETINEKNLNRVIDEVNRGGQVDPNKLKQLNDFSKKSEAPAQPSQNEIAQAMQTLQKAGMNPYSNPNSSPEMLQMNMLMGAMGGGSGTGSSMNSMNMLPLLMMSQGNGQKIDPQLMQTMVTNMMMPNMFSLNGNNNDNNY